MKNYQLLYENPVHYILHDKTDKKVFHVAKSGLDESVHDTIRNLPRMKEFKSYDNDQPSKQDIPGTDPRPLEDQPQNFDGGGSVQPTSPPIDPDKAKAVSDSFKKALGFADGTPEVPSPEMIQELDSPAQPAPEIPEEVASGERPGAPAAMVQEDVAAQAAALPPEQAAPEAPMGRAPASEAPKAGGTPYYLAKPETPHPIVSPEAIDKVAEQHPHVAAVAKQQIADKVERQSNLDQQLADNQKRYQELVDKSRADDERFGAMVAQNKIDPNRMFNNQTLMQKITMGLGLGLAGVGAGLTHSPNAALEVIHNAINRDIDAQKNDQSQSMNLWKMNHESLKDQQAASLQTRNQMLEAAKVKIDELMGTAPGPMALERAKALKTQIQAEQMQNLSSIARAKMVQSLMNEQNAPGKPGQLSARDPATLVSYLVPTERQKEVFQEIHDAQNINKNGPKILEAYDSAVKDKSLSSGKINPASINVLHQLMLPLFENIDGTVRQAAMDESFKNLSPVLLDSGDKAEKRRQALVDWITSRSAAPTSKGFGIDLNKYASTSHDVGGEVKSMDGVKYQKISGGWKKIH